MSATVSAHLFRHVFEQAGIGMALVGLDGSFLHVNRALSELVGYREEELLQSTFQDITHPDDLEKDLGHVNELLRGEIDNYQMQKRYIHRLGHSVWVLLTGALLKEGDEPQMFIAQIQDITEWKMAEGTSNLIFDLPVALHFVAGFDGYFKKLPATWTEVLGYPIEELLAHPYLDFVHPDDHQRTIEQAAKIAQGSETVLFENRYRHADGTYRWILWTTISRVGEELIYGVALDYTPRKQMELELKTALEEQQKLYADLQASTERIQKLREGLVTVCAWTKRILHDGKWISPDEFLRDHLQIKLSHGISDEAAEKFLE